MRAVLTHHLLFAFNRLGVSAEHQYVLATAASRAVFGEELMSQRPPTTTHPGQPSPEPDETTVDEPERLRAALVDHIRGRGTFHTTQVENAFRTVPRHLFLPDVDLTEAYAPRPVVTKRAANGTAVSSASSPNLVAEMLELLDVAPGQRILEVGAATGINAALLAELTGPTGQVVTIELDDDLATGAREALTRAGYPQVEVICGDGALGHPAGAPYDRIIVTAGAWDIPAPWWQQLAPDGRLVVPVRLHGSGRSCRCRSARGPLTCTLRPDVSQNPPSTAERRDRCHRAERLCAAPGRRLPVGRSHPDRRRAGRL